MRTRPLVRRVLQGPRHLLAITVVLGVFLSACASFPSLALRSGLVDGSVATIATGRLADPSGFSGLPPSSSSTPARSSLCSPRNRRKTHGHEGGAG